MGRWAFAAAWVSEDRATARDVVRARLAGAADIATRAAMAAGRGDADRFVLVSAIARLKEAFEGGEGTLAEMAFRAMDEAAGQLVANGSALRSAVQRERAAFAPRFGLEGFAAAMLDAGSERNVLMREASRGLDEALLTARGPCPALRTLRLFLRASLAIDSNDPFAVPEGSTTAKGHDPVAVLGMWLAADLALASRRGSAYEAALRAAAKASGDALSRTISGLAAGERSSKGVAQALQADPVALLLALAMTTTAEHASALLDHGVQAQSLGRVEAGREVVRWGAEARRVDELEARLGVSVQAPGGARQGHRDHENVGGLDLFAAWHAARTAQDACASLREGALRSVSAESKRRREAVRRAKAALDRAKRAYEAELEAGRGRLETAAPRPVVDERAEESAQRGCVFGFGAGCSVLGTYAAVGVVIGTGGIVGRIAPIVVGVAAIPVATAIVIQVALSARRALAAAEANRRRTVASAEFERLRTTTARAHGGKMAILREALSAAEAEARDLERRLGPTDLQAAA